MKVLRDKDGELYTTCSYQHNVQIDCNDCCNGKLEAAVKAFKAKEARTLYCVTYRTGGTDNFEWKRTSAMTKAEAIKAQAEIQNGGRRALVQNYAMSVQIGLPTTYGPEGIK